MELKTNSLFYGDMYLHAIQCIRYIDTFRRDTLLGCASNVLYTYRGIGAHPAGLAIGRIRIRALGSERLIGKILDLRIDCRYVWAGVLTRGVESG